MRVADLNQSGLLELEPEGGIYPVCRTARALARCRGKKDQLKSTGRVASYS